MRDLTRSTYFVGLSVAAVAIVVTVVVTVLSVPRVADLTRPATVVALVLGAAVVVVAALLSTWFTREPLHRIQARLCALAGDAPPHRGQVGADPDVHHILADLDLLADRIQTMTATVSRGSSVVAEASARLAADGRQVGDGLADASRHAHQVTETAQGASRIWTSSNSTEEISQSTRSIADNLAEANQVAGQAVEMAESTNQIVAKLGESSTEIGNVVRVITKIAGQTKLLALNASIEAHRAGDLGTGFAVVATEVKDLAQKTAAATEEISQRVAAIQADSAEAVAAVWAIGSVIEQINDFQRAIANAVEEQTTITSGVDRNVTSTADATSEVANAVGAMMTALDSTREAISDTDRLVARLADVSREMQEAVGATPRTLTE